jgi:hypothetical protein
MSTGGCDEGRKGKRLMQELRQAVKCVLVAGLRILKEHVNGIDKPVDKYESPLKRLRTLLFHSVYCRLKVRKITRLRCA